MHIPTRHDILVSVGFMLILGLLVFSGLWVFCYRTRAAKVDFRRYPVKGIDISAHNGEVDFRRVREAGYSFVWIKAGEGETFRDARFANNYDAAVSAGLAVGAYHYFRFDCDGMLQAINLCQALDGRLPALGVAIDIEEEGNAAGVSTPVIISRLSAMLDYLNMRGFPITLYSNKDGYYEYLQDEFSDYPLWICSFTDSMPIEDAPQWSYWQYSHSGNVPGIEGKVDENVSRVPLEL